MAVAIDAARERAVAPGWLGFLKIMPIVVKLGALAGLSSVMVVMIWVMPRIFLSMANDGLLPSWPRKYTRDSVTPM